MFDNYLDFKSINELSTEADNYILARNIENLKNFFLTLLDTKYQFENVGVEARYYYILGNCSQMIHQSSDLNWFSDELSKSTIFFRKALYIIKKEEKPTKYDIYLQSCIETNLGNELSNQGRLLCCIPIWDSVLKSKYNAVSIISKANNAIHLANHVYDPEHRDYHFYIAYNLIQLGLTQLDHLFPEQKVAYASNSYFMNFIDWFEGAMKPEDYFLFGSFSESSDPQKNKGYLDWCGDNKLFINDLNDVCISELVYKDDLSLPSITQPINDTLSLYESYMYHGNFDELKDEYCYARYLIFTAKNIANDQQDEFNSTFRHVDDMSYSITNLKTNHYKSAFRSLYSIFDKIAYFINRFFDLNDISNDHRITFLSIFKNLEPQKNKKNIWQPHPKLKESKNLFIHALFYILKDMRDVQDSDSVSRWLDPDAKAFFEIRNAIEHRSLKIVDDFGYILTQSDKPYKHDKLDKLKKKIKDLELQLQVLSKQIDSTQNDTLKSELEIQKESIVRKLQLSKTKVHEQQKLSSHSLLITVSEFESRLMTLMKLARNSIMYLALAIHFEERNKNYGDELMIEKDVPLR